MIQYLFETFISVLSIIPIFELFLIKVLIMHACYKIFIVLMLSIYLIKVFYEFSSLFQFPLNGSALLPPENASSAHTVTITVNDKTHIIGNNTSSLDLGAKTRIPMVDSVPGTSASMVVLKKVEKKESSEPPSESSDLSANVYDVVGANISDRCLQTRSVSSSPGIYLRLFKKIYLFQVIPWGFGEIDSLNELQINLLY